MPNDMVIYLEIEKSRIAREKARMVLQKSLALYTLFMIIAIVGFSFNYIDSYMLNAFIILGIIILVVGTLPYLIVVHKEEKKINDYLKALKSKKGITPLISTVLLLIFAIGLGATIMSWGNAQRTSLNCKEVELAFTQLNGIEQTCLEGATLKLTLENNGNSKIEKLTLVGLTESSYFSKDIDLGIPSGEFRQLSIDTPAEKILKIRVIPYSSGKCVSKRAETQLRRC